MTLQVNFLKQCKFLLQPRVCAAFLRASNVFPFFIPSHWDSLHSVMPVQDYGFPFLQKCSVRRDEGRTNAPSKKFTKWCGRFPLPWSVIFTCEKTFFTKNVSSFFLTIYEILTKNSISSKRYFRFSDEYTMFSRWKKDMSVPIKKITLSCLDKICVPR